MSVSFLKYIASQSEHLSPKYPVSQLHTPAGEEQFKLSSEPSELQSQAKCNKKCKLTTKNRKG